MKTLFMVLVLAVTGCAQSSDNMVLGYPQASIATHELSDDEVENDVDVCESIDTAFTENEIKEMFTDFNSNCR